MFCKHIFLALLLHGTTTWLSLALGRQNRSGFYLLTVMSLFVVEQRQERHSCELLDLTRRARHASTFPFDPRMLFVSISMSFTREPLTFRKEVGLAESRTLIRSNLMETEQQVGIEL